jgi:hypothetical protein
MVLITTHSDPTTGYLHMGPNNVGSVPVQEVEYFILFIYFKFLNQIPAFGCHFYSPLPNHFAKRQQQYPCPVIMWCTLQSSRFKGSDKEFCEEVCS